MYARARLSYFCQMTFPPIAVCSGNDHRSWWDRMPRLQCCLWPPWQHWSVLHTNRLSLKETSWSRPLDNTMLIPCNWCIKRKPAMTVHPEGSGIMLWSTVRTSHNKHLSLTYCAADASVHTLQKVFRLFPVLSLTSSLIARITSRAEWRHLFHYAAALNFRLTG